MELNLVQKSGSKVLEFEKNVIELKSKSSKFGKTFTQTLTTEPPHKF
jgi:hypothetical protein